MTTLQSNQLSNTIEDPQNRPRLILNHTDFGSVTNDILKGNDAAKPPRSWWIALGISFSMMSMLGVLIGYLIFTGVGVWGNNNPVATTTELDRGWLWVQYLGTVKVAWAPGKCAIARSRWRGGGRGVAAIEMTRKNKAFRDLS